MGPPACPVPKRPFAVSGKDLLGTSKGHEVSTVGLWGLGLHGGFPRRGSSWAEGRHQGGRKKCARGTEDRLPELPRRLGWASPPAPRLSRHLRLAWCHLLSPLWLYPASTVSVRERRVHLPETRVGPDVLCKEACVFFLSLLPGDTLLSSHRGPRRRDESRVSSALLGAGGAGARGTQGPPGGLTTHLLGDGEVLLPERSRGIPGTLEAQRTSFQQPSQNDAPPAGPREALFLLNCSFCKTPLR